MAKIDSSLLKVKNKARPAVAKAPVSGKKKGAKAKPTKSSRVAKPTDDKRADVMPEKKADKNAKKEKRISFPVASGGKKGKSPKSLKDLKAAHYNPREITAKQLTQLEGSVKKFGDLSGITFNVASGVLVTGHQRVRVTQQYRSRIVRKEQKRDAQGTVATGFVEVEADNGKSIKIPYREVDWDVNTEMAANVAANSAGGSFEMVKLGKILKALDKGKFAIEEIPIDPWEMKKSMVLFESQVKKSQAGVDGKGEFEKIDPKDMKLQHQCPKCGFGW